MQYKVMARTQKKDGRIDGRTDGRCDFNLRWYKNISYKLNSYYSLYSNTEIQNKRDNLIKIYHYHKFQRQALYLMSLYH